MSTGLIARATVEIDAPKSEVWDALVNPDKIKDYMFGANVHSNWEKGEPITWSGNFKGKPYEDKGEIVEIEPEACLCYTHFSAMSGEADRPENYHTVAVELRDHDGKTEVELRQDNNRTEEAKLESEKNWSAMLDGLKKTVESRTRLRPKL